MCQSHRLSIGAAPIVLLAASLWAAEPEWKAGLLNKLEKPVSADFVETPVRDVVRFLGATAGCTVVVDGTVDGARQVTFRTKAMPARAVLSWLCFLTESTWLLRDEAVLVCSREKAASFVERRREAYDVSEFTRDPEHARVVNDIAERMLHAPRGAKGASVALEAGPRLAVTACETGHASVARLLDALRRVPRNGKLTWEPPRPDASALIEIVADRDKWPGWAKDAMDRKISFDFVETPLVDVVAFLSSLTNICIILDPAGEELRNLAVTLRVNDMRLGAAFAWVLKLADARFAVTPHALLVAKARRIAELEGETAPFPVAVHEVSDILAEGWHLSEVVGGLGGYVYGPGAFALGFGTRVVVATTAPRLETAGTLIEAMRGGKTVCPRPGRARPAWPEWGARIRETLSKRVSFDFVETPLQDVLSFISALVDLTIVLDTEALKDKPRFVTLKVKDMRLEAALGWLLRLTGIQYALKDEAIFISTRQRTSARPVTWMIAAWGAVAKPEEARALARFVENFLKSLPDARPDTRCWARPGYALSVAALGPHTELAADLVGWLAHSKPGECHELGDARAVMLPPPALARLREAMKKKISFDFVETPLHDVVSFVSSLSDTTIVLDPEAAKDKALKVTLRVNDMRLQNALDWALKLVKLQSVVMDEAVFVTTPERARAVRPTACVLYDLRHLIGPRLASAELDKFIRAACQRLPEWAPSHRIAEFKGRFVICTTPAIHSAMPDVLRAVAAATTPLPKPPETAPAPRPAPQPRPAAPFVATDLKKGREVGVFLKDGELVTGKLFSASPHHLTVMADGKLLGIAMDKVQKIVQDGRTFVPAP